MWCEDRILPVTFYLNFLFFNGEQLIIIRVTVSGGQQRDSAIYIYMYPFSPKLPSQFSNLKLQSNKKHQQKSWCEDNWRVTRKQMKLEHCLTPHKKNNLGFLHGSVVKDLPANAGDIG